MPRPAYPLLALLVLPLAACDGGNTFTERLTPAQVSGSYNICSFSFRPENPAFPVADLLASVMDTNPPTGRPAPSLALSAGQYQYDLVYTRRRDGFLQQLRGPTFTSATSVTARFFSENPSSVAAEALLPASLPFAFQDAPRRLTAATGNYTVRRADYAAAAGIPETGLQDRVSGRLEAVLQVGGCP